MTTTLEKPKTNETESKWYDGLKKTVEALTDEVGEMKDKLTNLIKGRRKDEHALATYQQPWLGGRWPQLGWPRVDVTETEKELTVRAELPGMDREDVELQLLPDNVLVICGNKHDEHELRDGGRYQYECYYGSFHRSVQLPCEVDFEGCTAKFRRGVLNITLPKLTPSKVEHKRIEIKG